MRVLIGCEESGVVRDAFIRAGHDAMSCDLLPTRSPGPHYAGHVFDVIDYPFDYVSWHQFAGQRVESIDNQVTVARGMHALKQQESTT